MRAALCVILPAWLALAAINFQFPTVFQDRRVLTDFDAFYIAGLMYWEGTLYDAYAFASLAQAQLRFTGTVDFMPWAYPPPFNLVTAALAGLPAGLAYLAFTGVSLLAYLVVLQRLAGIHLAAVLIAVFPAILLNIRTGQNGFLTGALLGTFLLSYLGHRAAGGVALGAMIIKPHLAIGGALLCLADRRWGRIGASALAAGALLALSGMVLGPGIYPAFLAGMGEAGQYLAQGSYPLYRMVSLYAGLHRAGVPPALALAVQVALALLLCALVLLVALRTGDRRKAGAFALAASLLMSPYSYDYDLAILGVAAAAIWPDLAVRTGKGGLALLLLLSWLACGSGLAVLAWNVAIAAETTGAAGTAPLPSLGGLALLALLIAATLILRRPPPAARACAPA